MSSGLYKKFKEACLTQSPAVILSSDTVKAVLVRTDSGHYAVDLSAHQFLSDIASGDRIATSGALTTKSETLGVFNADNLVFSAVTGAQVGAVVLYKDTGVAGTSPLLAYIDTVTGFPLVPSGADIDVNWDAGTNKIFVL